MAGQQFEYDERGSTFYFFIASFYAFVLIPLTYFFWPRRSSKGQAEEGRRCHCEPCLLKQSTMHRKKPNEGIMSFLIKFYLIIGWLVLAVIMYKALSIETDGGEYDPYAVLELSSGATPSEIRKQYHQLSLKYHPDRGGDTKKFVAISKAYQALTDEDTRRNFEEYGNPDGPEALRLGIALPSWLISKEYAFWVIGFYVVVFMVVLPVAVGTWWFRSIKYNPDSVLIDTTQLYFYMFHKTPLLQAKRLIMILAGSFEFCRSCNSEIVERPSDDVEVPNLIKMLPSLGENKKERPLCYPYSVKARALLHAHFNRMLLPIDTLRNDLTLILRKCLPLVQEMTNVYLQLVAFAATGRVSRMPALETLDNTMKLSSMIVQAVWDHRSPLLQLPHFSDDNVRHLQYKKRFLRTCADLAHLDHADRRQALRFFDDHQYNDVICVLSSMPKVEMNVRFEVQDEEDMSIITAGSLVTCAVKMVRKPLITVPVNNVSRRPSKSPKEASKFQSALGDKEMVREQSPPNLASADGAVANGVLNGEPVESAKNQRKVWEKPKKRKGGKNKKKQGGGVVAKAKAPVAVKVADVEVASAEAVGKDQGSAGSESDISGEATEVKDSNGEAISDDDDDLLIDEMAIKRERKILENVSKVTHPVHCPYFPDDKYEWWWIFVCDRKRRMLISPPVNVTNLKEEAEVELKFPAPTKPGRYVYQVCLRSDSYMDADQVKDVKFEVHEARQIVSHPQWDFTEEKSGAETDQESEYTEVSEEEDELTD